MDEDFEFPSAGNMEMPEEEEIESPILKVGEEKEIGNEAIKLTKAGELLSASLTSTTFPEIGELISLVAFTLSTAPKLPPCVTAAPTSGNSTYTTSPK